MRRRFNGEEIGFEKIKVMVVDDSALMRKIISDMINSQADMEVVNIARNGQELVNKLEETKPDVITLDVQMPVMDGIEALKVLKRLNISVPVIVLSSVSTRDTQLTMECLEAGAFDFIAKPSGQISLDIDKVKDFLIEKIRIAYKELNQNKVFDNLDIKTIKTLKSEKKEKSSAITRRGKNNIEAVVIGASTGGPRALYTVITALPSNIGVPIFVVQHMPSGFTKAFAERLNMNSDIKVVEAVNGQVIMKDVVYVAPGGLHMEIRSDNKISLNDEPSVWGVRPAADKLFISASKVYQSSLLSVVLTGMGKDGSKGTVEVKKNGGTTMAEHESTCTIYGMPKAAYETGMVDFMVPINEIPIEITKLVMR